MTKFSVMYKVLSVNGYIYESAFNISDYRIRYAKGEWARPVFGKLFVFDTLENAINWMKKDKWGNVIFECEVENPTPINELIPSFSFLIRCFWEDLDRIKKTYRGDLKSAPIGSIWCDAVKITTLVEKI